MSSIELYAKEIEENWKSTQMAEDEMEEFYTELYEDGDEVERVMDQLRNPPETLTKKDAKSVMLALRKAFPRPEEKKDAGLCDYCCDYDETPRKAVVNRSIGMGGCDAVCAICLIREDEEVAEIEAAEAEEEKVKEELEVFRANVGKNHTRDELIALCPELYKLLNA